MNPAIERIRAEAIKECELGLQSLPVHMHEGVRNYLIHGIPPGGFLYAVLANDLKEAALSADQINRDHLAEWGAFAVHFLPHRAQGSYEKVRAWCAAGGLNGVALSEEGVDGQGN